MNGKKSLQKAVLQNLDGLISVPLHLKHAVT
jgi:hypothetical protein